MNGGRYRATALQGLMAERIRDDVHDHSSGIVGCESFGVGVGLVIDANCCTRYRELNNG